MLDNAQPDFVEGFDEIAESQVPTIEFLHETEEERASKKKEAELKALEARGQGYIALGHSTDTNGVCFWLWSHPQKKVIMSSDSTLGKKLWLQSVAGVEYANAKWSIERFDKNGDSEGDFFNANLAAEEIITAAQGAGPWTPIGAVRGSGTWYDGPHSLIVNSRDGVYRICGDSIEPVTRCSAERRQIYIAAERGAIAESEASIDDVQSMIKTIAERWLWRRPSDGFLAAGWLLMQPYCAALDDGRAHLYVTGQTDAGKSYLERYFRDTIGGWGLHIEAGRESSVSGLRQLIKTDAITVLIDEVEPKAGASDVDREKLNSMIKGMLQMLRSSYSQSRSGSISAVKGTASGTAQVFDIRVSAMIAGMIEGDLEQADRNRFLRLALQKQPRDSNGNLINQPPEMPDEDFGPRLFRRMWSRWGRFTELRRQIMKLISYSEERMRMTLGGPIAALLIATDTNIDSASAVDLIEMINADYCGADAVDDARPDAETALERLLDLNLRVQREGASPIEMPLADVIARAIVEGGGNRGRGMGGDFGTALRAHGMTVKLETDTIWLFMADKHLEFERLTRPVGFPNLATLLRQTPGAEPTMRKGGRDTRVRVGAGGLRSGVWIKTSIDLATVK